MAMMAVTAVMSRESTGAGPNVGSWSSAVSAVTAFSRVRNVRCRAPMILVSTKTAFFCYAGLDIKCPSFVEMCRICSVTVSFFGAGHVCTDKIRSTFHMQTCLMGVKWLMGREGGGGSNCRRNVDCQTRARLEGF